MDLRPAKESELDIDLAFHGFSDANLLDLLTFDARNLLLHDEVWSKTFIKWLALIRSSEKVICPEIVKERIKFSFGLQFTDDYTISLINKKWRHKESPTDVLSFPAIDESICYASNEYVELGDIIVSVPTAFEQAKEHNHSLDRELKWLVCHGFLHLLGWNHSNTKTLKKMLDFQDKLILFESDLRVISCS